jgi:formate hydrogenlyase subunit 6/NADH:ubiquinone oxidoreductase subunit I
MLKLELQHLGALLDALAGQGKVYAPFRKGSRTDFAWYDGTDGHDAAALDWEHYTAKAPKDLLFPQVENLLRFRQQGKKLDLEAAPLPTDPVIAFGVRGCDIAGFAILDKVFLQEPADACYRARRENLTILGLACSEPEETCFCRTFGLDPAAPGGDVDLWIAEGNLYWEARTDKGRHLTEAIRDAVPFEDAEPAPVEAQRKAVHELYERLPLGSLRFDDRLHQHELEAFQSPVWKSLAATCLTCCTCTYVCPTCHCFDVRDERTAPGTTERYRCWDSCMDRDFTQMPHGNPRKGKTERFRQRYMHKLVYFPEDYNGTYACVGCGRCLKACPVNLNIVKVEQALAADPGAVGTAPDGKGGAQ